MDPQQRMVPMSEVEATMRSMIREGLIREFPTLLGLGFSLGEVELIYLKAVVEAIEEHKQATAPRVPDPTVTEREVLIEAVRNRLIICGVRQITANLFHACCRHGLTPEEAEQVMKSLVSDVIRDADPQSSDPIVPTPVGPPS